uniref:hypothetical protein n=1 Tax=Actinokineospora sp. CA-119265 TaxID=3239890 RepID=UPI003F499718
MIGTDQKSKRWKGPRRQLGVRVPDPLADAVAEKAAAAGMTVNDWVGEQLAKLTGVPYQQQGVLMSP